MRILFIAPASNLKTTDEIMRAAQGQTVTICDDNVDRDKVERFLREEYDAIHFAGHGDLSVLGWSDGPVEEQDLVGMMAQQTRLRFVVITACNSAGVGNAIHNALHVPVIMCQAPIGDAAAVRFSETFYRTLRLTDDLRRAYEAGWATVARLFPGDANIVTMVNGDMATHSDLTECMKFVRAELSAMRVKLEDIEVDMKDVKGQQPRAILAGLVLLALIFLATVAMPLLTASASAGR